MAKSPKKPKLVDIETESDGWDRFANAVDVLAKTVQQHWKAKPKPEKKAKRADRQ